MITTKTKFGTIEGKQKGSAVLFAGIPYAKPPVGELRFRPAQDPEPWEGIRPAQKESTPCMQLGGEMTGRPHVISGTSEDCLYLNVRTPAPQLPGGRKGTADTVIDTEAGLPVYVFVHGGAYNMGGSHVPLYDGRAFADQGIVYVNINYRLSVFGAMTLDALMEESEKGTAGDYSFTDVMKALEWVHENIRAFGGDPDNVTLGGESAGAFLVSVMLHTEAAGKYFKRAILESGTARGTAPKNHYGREYLENRKRECRQLAAELGADDSPEGLEKLRAVPAEDLIMAWFYKPDGTPKNIFSDPAAVSYLYGREKLPQPSEIKASVDLLFGFNTNEGTMFIDQNASEEDYFEYIKKRFPVSWKELTEKYPVDKDHTPFDRMAENLGLVTFTGSMLPYGDQLSDNGGRVWAYHFDFLTDRLKREGLGVRHIAELHFVFDRYLRVVGANNEEGEAMACIMNSAWAAFIKTGDPGNAEELEQEWPPYSRGSRQCMRFSHDICSGEIPRLSELLYLEELLEKEYGETHETE